MVFVTWSFYSAVGVAVGRISYVNTTKRADRKWPDNALHKLQ